VTENSVFINGIEIINSKAKNTYKIFSILYDQYLEDLNLRKNSNNFKYININKIANLLEKETNSITSTEDQIRRPLNKLRKHIKIAIENAFRTHISTDCVIEFAPWNNLSDNKFGFRINPLKVCLKPA
jgi:hypothetical protein